MLKRLSIIGVSLVALTVAANAEDYPETSVRFGHSIGATGSSAQGDAWVAEELAKRSNGKVNFQMFWAGAAGSPAELFDLVSTGALDAAAITPSWYAANLPMFAPLSSVPFSYPDVETAQKVAKTLYAEVPALKAEADKNNLHVMRFPLLNNYHALCTAPIRTIDDFKGKKIRSQGDYLPLVLDALGATPVTVLPGEFYEALQRGTVDCIVLPWDLLAANRLYEVAKYGSDVNFGPIVGHVSMMNLDKWNSLDPAVQKLITEVQAEAEAKDIAAAKDTEAKALATIKENGVEVIAFPDQAKLEAAIPDLLAVWAQRMGEKGSGDAATAMAARWKEIR